MLERLRVDVPKLWYAVYLYSQLAIGVRTEVHVDIV